MAKLLGCVALLMTLAFLPQAFIPAVSGPHGASKAPLTSSADVMSMGAVEVSAEQTATAGFAMPLVCGLAMGLALALPQAAMAASNGNEGFDVWLDRVTTKEAMGAFGIAGLSWNVFYLGVTAAALGLIFVACIGAFFVGRPRTMKDAPPVGQRKLPTPPIVDASALAALSGKK
eukprot:gb/GFBE01046832.1/.p1 GENE.gb/GFBE01046832.1/~~gb/GFBE01046832.1/.p1  ORF type:complete len:174 (+),score=43.04 gb/GFBE01046832.1/:1-522(+)